ncbi:Peptide-methionine (S)-S-oxide reductase MsrA (EC 1.8.4.11) / Thiol:disulfide oxidoreductase associated with MetSO reductase / Peptide-methionine (R)-S-oxide reductase MsrB (EC 1.8.4.12) [uncultured Gammaproteobacteria bacterium]|uniref:peptide-methionine (S)-S-oxide reductase MsrA n=1 Tax=Bathymodiolus heckerae thiotrophic gill symbiont TaxID=1052212 RepID=UPI0010B23BE3|nr:peptide-methionine (S)-S-oxide reductase MsrA [Bathymodiolus heckerae thiotrophic gill symbiont]CAC9442694.1 Peptide-methionine (S)-S-oxide reductase MsrA (EC 1.8.4.11) / Thiol:disulfide oxidoreductase associated with MetSO reductase / Peptide-methionine (R)-S-oxide reductase MsrB (EC 1.8.4.12) [uncultured Gammaproteobacteria bacterium]CAC9449587.1 Peptide-methionine (S)-S-oxide reductase MsrA (EC 1.8.4.11) / Thiol:disulfide oxidoreductase associated with MetSO reductase / Peptide-methionine (
MLLEIVFAAGCFWGVEKNFEQISGVVDVASGYAGGNYDNPTYRQVIANKDNNNAFDFLSLLKKINWSNEDEDETPEKSTNIINHTEVVKVTYDTKLVSTEFLIKNFWELHNPTQIDGQGNDKGNNYRSAIYWTTDEQRKIAFKTKDEYQKLLTKKGFGNIVTELKSLDKFWQAEDYHQDYLANNPNGYCPNHKTGVKFADKGMIKEQLSGTYNKHLKDLILEPLKGKEIVVIETDAYCPYCVAFKKKVLNNYQGSIPVRSVFAQNLKGYTIKTPTFATPTILFIEDGVEQAGFQGYLSPKEFYKALGKFKLGSSKAFDIAFNEGTEGRFCKQYDIFKNTPDGVFVDKLSGVPLFDTDDRFNSKSGWLSFTKAIDDTTIEKPDNRFGMSRVEILSKSTGIHLGHVFEDGPNNTRRFCINANVLEFVADKKS